MGSGIEDRRQNIITKDAPAAPISQKIPSLGATSEELWMKTRDIRETYVGHLNEQTYTSCKSQYHSMVVLKLWIHLNPGPTFY